jgi:uncharacterized membrane protein YukC
MAFGRAMSNNKRQDNQRKSWKKHRIRKAERVRVKGGQKQAEIVDDGLITKHHLRKRTTCARANITLSGKKRNKLLKQLKHMQADKSRMDVEVAAKSKKTTKQKDVEMKEDTEETTEKEDNQEETME